MSRKQRSRIVAVPATLCLCLAGIIAVIASSGLTDLRTGAPPLRGIDLGGRVVSTEMMVDLDGSMCVWEPASASTRAVAALQGHDRDKIDPELAKTFLAAGAKPEEADQARGTSVVIDRPPVRAIRDSFPTYSAVGVDLQANEVYLQDENLFGFMVFDRLTNTPPKARYSEPKRRVQGINTRLEFNCAIWIDQNNGDIYSVNNDMLDQMVVFPRGASGNQSPKRQLHTPHRAFGIAIDEDAQELFLTVQHSPQVVVYRKAAAGEEKPLRVLRGEHTGLADAHGIALDTKRQLMFVVNHGATGDIPGKGGRFDPPSISVYPLKAQGDTPPLRVIQGPKTQMNWPALITVDQEREELYVANDMDNSILVFRTGDNEDAAPKRVLRGSKTELKNPTSVYLDPVHDELWVSNMGNHRATIYPRTASGDVSPLRVIRSAPEDTEAQMIGNPGALGYDSKREQILVPNCVAHPQIAAFARLAGVDSKPERVIAGQKTLLSRTMHDIRYDPVHDEMFVTNPFANAILVFRGSANGEEAPVRVIQGPHTQLRGNTDRLEIDTVHNEIYVPMANAVAVYPLNGDGDISPLRVVRGSNTHLDSGTAVAVDPVHNVFVVGTLGSGGEDGMGNGALLIFDRNANGNAKPLGVIQGPKSGIYRINQIQIQATKGLIVACQPGRSDIEEPDGVFVGIWDIHDSGDVPPRWKLAGAKTTLKKPRGVVLDYKHKTIIVADMRLNSVLTYSFPELF